MIRCFFLPILLCVSHLSAQEFLQIQGVVLDQKTQELLSFVHVGIPEKGIGTVTNQQGQFTFFFPAGHLNETLVVSHIGYFDLRQPLSQIDLKQPVRLAMQPNTVHLDEIEVLSTEYPLTHFVKKAIKNFNNNYPNRLHFMSGFYREAKINGETRKYDRLLEAAVDIQDKGVKSSLDNVRIQVNELRKSDDFSDYSQIDRELTAQYGDHNQLYDLFTRHPIRAFFNPTSPKGFKYNLLNLMQTHEDRLSLREVLYKNGTKIYVIDYHDFIFSGTVYLDSKDYGIHRLDYVANTSGLYSGKQKKVYEYTPDELVTHRITYRYQKIKGQYHLSLVRETSFDNFLNSTDKIDDLVYGFAVRTLIINNFYTDKKAFDRIKRRKMVKKDLRLYDLSMPYSQGFWKNYNVLTLEPLNPEVKLDLEWRVSLEEQFIKNGAQH